MQSLSGLSSSIPHQNKKHSELEQKKNCQTDLNLTQYEFIKKVINYCNQIAKSKKSGDIRNFGLKSYQEISNLVNHMLGEIEPKPKDLVIESVERYAAVNHEHNKNAAMIKQKLFHVLIGAYSNESLDSQMGECSQLEELNEYEALLRNVEESNRKMDKDIEQLFSKVESLNKKITKRNIPEISTKIIENVTFLLRKQMTKENIEASIKANQCKKNEKSNELEKIISLWNQAYLDRINFSHLIEWIDSGFKIIYPIRKLLDSLKEQLENVSNLRHLEFQENKTEEIFISYEELKLKQSNLKNEIAELIKKIDVIEFLKKKTSNNAEKLANKKNLVDSLILSNFITPNSPIKEKINDDLEDIYLKNHNELLIFYNKLVDIWNEIKLTQQQIENEFDLIETVKDFFPRASALENKFLELEKNTRNARLQFTEVDDHASNTKIKLFLFTGIEEGKFAVTAQDRLHRDKMHDTLEKGYYLNHLELCKQWDKTNSSGLPKQSSLASSTKEDLQTIYVSAIKNITDKLALLKKNNLKDFIIDNQNQKKTEELLNQINKKMTEDLTQIKKRIDERKSKISTAIDNVCLELEALYYLFENKQFYRSKSSFQFSSRQLAHNPVTGQ